MKFDIHKAVTDKIIEMIENGQANGKWEAPWNRVADTPVNAETKKAYRGVNILLLWGAKMQHGYTSDYWATFKQWKKKGHKLVDAKGKGVMIVFWMIREKKELDAQGNEKVKKIPYLQYSYVFNADLVEGFIEPEKDSQTLSDTDRQAEIDDVIANTGATIIHGGNRACYIPSIDQINLPAFTAFETPEGYYSTAFHELAHWTGHESRLSREFSGRFGDESYAFEELIAELSAAFTCAQLGIEAETRDDHAKYIASWLKVLKNDSKAIITAASQASKASQYIVTGETVTTNTAKAA